MSTPHTLSLQFTKLQIMNIDTKAKLLFKFNSLQTMYVDSRPKKLLRMSHYTDTCATLYMLSRMSTPTHCRQLTKLQIMIVDTKAKLPFKFGSLESMYVDLRSKNITFDSTTCEIWYYMYVHALTHVNFPYLVTRLQNSRL